MYKLPRALVAAGVVGIGLFRYIGLRAPEDIAFTAFFSCLVAFFAAWVAAYALHLAIVATANVAVLVAIAMTQNPVAQTLLSVALLALPFGMAYGLQRTTDVPQAYSRLLFIIQTFAMIAALNATGYWPLLCGVAGALLIAIVAWVEHKIPTVVADEG